LTVGLAAVALLPGDASAGRRVCRQKQVAAVHQQFAVTNFAVPIGLPVASTAAFAYQSGAQYAAVGYQPRQYAPDPRQLAPQPQYQMPGLPAPASCSACQCQQQKGQGRQMTAAQLRVAQLRAELAALEAGGDVEEQSPAPSLVAQACAKCHNANPTAAGVVTDFSNLDALTCEQRLLAIGRILSNDPARRMPNGQTLDAQTIGLLIQELSQPGDPAPGPAPNEPGVPVPPVPKVPEVPAVPEVK